LIANGKQLGSRQDCSIFQLLDPQRSTAETLPLARPPPETYRLAGFLKDNRF
jgi:hypothetical protein